MSKSRILLTGGGGYVGSVAAHYFRDHGFDVLIVDDFSTGYVDACRDVPFIRASITDEVAMQKAFAEFRPDCVVHLAAVSDILACNRDPERATLVNVTATESLLRMMQAHGCNKIVFASSGAVYATQKMEGPFKETHPLESTSIYGKTKIAAEKSIITVSGITSVVLRFFNVAGADTQHHLGERHNPETHLIPNVLNALLHNQEIVVYGTDYPTADGTAMRDYIHVLDIADALYQSALHVLKTTDNKILNVGSGSAYSVLSIIRAAENIMQVKANIRYYSRRTGDAISIQCNCNAIENMWAWKPRHSTLDQIINSAVAWHTGKAFAA